MLSHHHLYEQFTDLENPDQTRLLDDTAAPAAANKKNVHKHVPTNGDTPLLKATRNKQIDVMTDLLKQNANVSAKDNQGNTPLHIAIYNNHPEAMDILLKHIRAQNPKRLPYLFSKNPLTIKNSDKLTPLQLALKLHNSDLAILLTREELETAPMKKTLNFIKA